MVTFRWNVVAIAFMVIKMTLTVSSDDSIFESDAQKTCCLDGWATGTDCQHGCWNCACSDGGTQCGCIHLDNVDENDYYYVNSSHSTADPTTDPTAHLTVNPTTSPTAVSYHYVTDGSSTVYLPQLCNPDLSSTVDFENQYGNTNVAVSCCSLDGTSGSRPNCQSGKTYAEAVQICDDEGMRLCTADEMDDGVTEGEGCAFDVYHNWVSDECKPYHLINDGSSTAYLQSECIIDTSDQATTINQYNNYDIAVSCCSLDGTIGYRPGCTEGVTYGRAAQVCWEEGYRLCTVAELEDGITEGEGCSFDAHHNWVSDECQPSNEPTTSPSNNPTNSPLNDPTQSPSSDPSPAPTPSPSVNLTTSPTADPTSDPTAVPTFNPTADPTADPTIDPTTAAGDDSIFESDAQKTCCLDGWATGTDCQHGCWNCACSDGGTQCGCIHLDNVDEDDYYYVNSADPTMDPTVDPTMDPTVDPTMDPAVDPTMDPTVDPTVSISVTASDQYSGAMAAEGDGAFDDFTPMMVAAAICVMLIAGIVTFVLLSMKRKRSGKKEVIETVNVHIPDASAVSVDGAETI